MNLLDSLPTELVVEICTYIFAGPTLNVDLHKHYQIGVYPLLLAYPSLWNELMTDMRFRFWYSMMKTRYYRDVQMRYIHRIHTDEVMDETRKYRSKTREERQRIEPTYRHLRKIGPVMYRLPYYRGMGYYQNFTYLARNGRSRNKSGRLFDQILQDARTGFAYEMNEQTGVFDGLAEMWPYHSRDDPAMEFHTALKFKAEQVCQRERTMMKPSDLETEFIRFLKQHLS